jgi:undecaprenyl-diphosphatase
MELNIVLHAGTLLSIVVIYWRSIRRILKQDRRAVGLLAVGTLPAVIIGLPLHAWCSEWLVDPLLAGYMLPLTGLLLLWAKGRRPGDAAYQDLSYGRALLIGAFQAVALLPGISRSGTTIVGGLMVGLRRDAAASFSFLLAIPAIAGACTLELKDLLVSGGTGSPWGLLVLGACVSFLVGLAALFWVLNWLERGRLHYFAYWCIPLGLAVVAWQVF